MTTAEPRDESKDAGPASPAPEQPKPEAPAEGPVSADPAAWWPLPLVIQRLTAVWRRWRLQPRHWDWMLICNVLLVLTAVGGWIAVQQQLNLAKTQAADSAKDTAESLKQATRAADAASKGADAAIKAAGAAKETAEATRQSVEAVRESTRLDQRAWVGVTVVMPVEIKEDRATFSTKILNSGRSPALRVVHTLTIVVGARDFRFRPTDPRLDQGSPPHTLQPGAWINGKVTSTPKFDSAMLSAIKDQRLVIYLFGRIDYRDIFGVPHTTRLCAQMTPDLKEASGSQACIDYDSAN